MYAERDDVMVTVGFDFNFDVSTGAAETAETPAAPGRVAPPQGSG
jgi:hypothetical protein